MNNRCTRTILSLVFASMTASFAGCGGGSSTTVSVSSGTDAQLGAGIPELAAWEARMRDSGRVHCQALSDRSAGFEEKLAATYYDAEWVFYQIADYTGDSSWHDCARAAEQVYRDGYVLANRGAIPGYWIFAHGLAQDYLRTGDDRSREALANLTFNAAFASDATPLSMTTSADQSREVAYNIMAYLAAEDVGEPRRARLSALVDQALGHMDQWFVSGSAPYVRPFMVSLTSQALIEYFGKTGDPRVPPAIERAADRMWETMWLPSAQAFKYTDRNHPSGGEEPAPDLNLLIAPVYGWLYSLTGAPRFAERGDQIFSGGVRGAFVGNPKQFNQNYRWSIEYVRWRGRRA